MLLLPYVFAVSAISLWENVQSTNTSDNHSNSTALNLRTLPPRLNLNASVAPSPLGPQVFASNETKLEDQDSEERVLSPPQILSRIPDGPETLITAGLHGGPEGYFHRLELTNGLRGPSDHVKLQFWLEHLDDLRRICRDFSNEKMLKLLSKKVTKEELYHLMDESTMKNSLRRLLLFVYPNLLPQMIKKGWLEADMSPEEMYYWLSISGTKRLTTSSIEAREVVFRKLYDWFVYVETSRASGNVVSDSAIVEVLVQKRGRQEAMGFLQWLRRKPELKDRVDGLQQQLVMRDPAILQDLLQSCLDANMSPERVLRMLLIVATHGDDSTEALAKVFFLIRAWFGYVDLFRGRGYDFSDGAIVEALVQTRGQPEAIKFLIWLWHKPEMKDRAVGLQQQLVMRDPAILQDLLQSCLDANMSPEGVLRMIPIVATHGDDSTEALADVFSLIKIWFAYVDLFRGRGYDFSDGAIVEALVQKRGQQEAMDFLFWLRHEPEMKDRVDGLQQQLVMRDPAILQDLLQSCLNAAISPERVLRMIPIVATHGDDSTEALADVFFLIRAWFGYVDLFRGRGYDFSDGAIVEALVQQVGRERMEVFIRLFERNPRTKRAADVLRWVFLNQIRPKK